APALPLAPPAPPVARSPPDPALEAPPDPLVEIDPPLPDDEPPPPVSVIAPALALSSVVSSELQPLTSASGESARTGHASASRSVMTLSYSSPGLHGVDGVVRAAHGKDKLTRCAVRQSPYSQCFRSLAAPSWPRRSPVRCKPSRRARRPPKRRTPTA